MYRKNFIEKTTIETASRDTGETIENKIERIVHNGEPIKDGAPLIYQERKDGVEPAYNVRTDKWDVAIDAMDAVSKTQLAKRKEVLESKTKKKDENTDKKDVKDEPTSDTSKPTEN